MNTQSKTIENLRLVLRLNSASCLFCGAVMAFYHSEIANVLGNANSVAVFVVGICLFFRLFRRICGWFSQLAHWDGEPLRTLIDECFGSPF